MAKDFNEEALEEFLRQYSELMDVNKMQRLGKKRFTQQAIIEALQLPKDSVIVHIRVDWDTSSAHIVVTYSSEECVELREGESVPLDELFE